MLPRTHLVEVKELTPPSCPLISTGVPWHTDAHRHTHMQMCTHPSINFFFKEKTLKCVSTSVRTPVWSGPSCADSEESGPLTRRRSCPPPPSTKPAALVWPFSRRQPPELVVTAVSALSGLPSWVWTKSPFDAGCLK